jgi:hypothetical protein
VEVESKPTMKIPMITALSIATAATALPLAASAHADTQFKFQSPRETSSA